MNKYRIIPYDMINDIWIIQKRILWIFWKTIGVGSKHKCQQMVDRLNK